MPALPSLFNLQCLPEMIQWKKRTRRLAIQSLETRRVLAASLGWDGPGLGSAALTYTISGTPDSLTQEETNAAIETAFDAWASAADIEFTEVDEVGLNDSIDITFETLDGQGGTLAQAYFPDDVNPDRVAGDIQFDLSEAWEVGNELGNAAFDLIWVAVHEIGHSLGLDHTDAEGSVLDPFVSAGQFFTELDDDDAIAITQLYAATDVSVEEPVDETGATDDTEVPTDPGTTDVEDDPVAEEPTSEDTDDGDTDETDNNDFRNRRFFWNRWFRNSFRQRFSGRLEAELISYNYVNPTDVNEDNSTTALDALMVINQLNQASETESENADLNGLCDVNGDGTVTSLDALMVINAMNDADDETLVSETEEMDAEPESDEEEVTTEGDTTDDTDVLLDEEDESNIDDGGLIDDPTSTDEETIDDETTMEDDDDHGSHGIHRRNHGLFRAGVFEGDASTFVERFDLDGDLSLSEEEVPERLWEKLSSLEVDGDTDGLLTADELEAAFLAAREERFLSNDADEDGVITETEVRDRLWAKLSEADSDADGGVSFAEWEVFRAESETTVTETESPDLSRFDRFDAAFNAVGRAASRGRFSGFRR